MAIFAQKLLGLGMILLVLTYQNYFFRRRKQEDALLQETALASEKKERARIAADLHDGILGDLTSTKNFLAILESSEKDSVKSIMIAGIK